MQIQHEQRRVWAEIDLDALEHNYRQIRSRLGSGAGLCCVIKANAYGHGAPAVAALYEQLGAECLAVSNIEEAIQLRNAEIQLPILILGYTPAPCVGELAKHRLTQCIYSYEYAKLLSDCASREEVTLDVHLKLDTGMGRIGFRYGGDEADEQSLDEMLRVVALPSLCVRGIFTHFSMADDGESGDAFSKQQYDLFCEAVRKLESRGAHFAIKHCANSAALMDHADVHMDMVRAGIVLYGLLPSDCIRNKPDLIPAMTLKSVVSHIKTVRPGESISYGRTFIAERDMRVATVPIGYADGYRRSNAEQGAALLIRGNKAPIIGRICMDQLMVDISHIPGVCLGDEVTVFGRAPAMTADEVARVGATVGYEILCAVGVRVPRVYLRGGRVVDIQDHLLP